MAPPLAAWRSKSWANHNGTLYLRTMRYSLRRALSFDSVDGCTHNPTICSSATASSNLPTSLVNPCRARLPRSDHRDHGEADPTATRVERGTATHFPDISAIRLNALFEQPARDYLRVKATHRADTKRWSLFPFRPTQNSDFPYAEQLAQLVGRCTDCGTALCAECRFECCGDSSASPATTITGRMLAFVSPSSLNVISGVQTEPADGWSRSSLPLVAPGATAHD